MKKQLLIALILLMAVCFTACSQEEEEEDYPELHGIGIEELIDVTIPNGFKKCGKDMEIGEPKVAVQKLWENQGKTQIGIDILSYDGEEIVLDEEAVDEFIEEEGIDVKEYNGYKFYIVSNSEDGSELTAYVKYNNYIIDFYITGIKTLTEEQKNMFYDMLKSVKFTPLDVTFSGGENE